jgi:hypothetical protein
MPFLIDGHNVISALPDIELSDPHDEVKLVLKLRGWAARKRRKATIVFDGGLPGGYSRTLSGGGLEVVFAARRHTNADRIIQERLRHLPDAGNWTVVSSDHEVRDAARRAGARTLTAQAFVKRLDRGPRLKLGKPKSLSEEELAEWLEIFGPAESAVADAPEKSAPPSKKDKQRRAAPPASGRSQRSMGEMVGWTDDAPDNKRSTSSTDQGKPEESSPEDVAEWLEIFGDGAAEAPPPKLPTNRPKAKRELKVDKDHPEAQSNADVEAWLDVFASAPQEAESPPPPPQTDEVKRSKTLREHKRRQGDGYGSKTEGLLSDEDVELWQRLFGEEPDA